VTTSSYLLAQGEVLVAEVEGRAIAAFHASCSMDDVIVELDPTCWPDRVGSWDGKSKVTVRAATDDERAQWEDEVEAAWFGVDIDDASIIGSLAFL
jgi:hypothetical protein